MCQYDDVSIRVAEPIGRHPNASLILTISNRLINAIFACSTHVRHVAIYQHGQLVSRVRPGLTGASGAEWSADRSLPA